MAWMWKKKGEQQPTRIPGAPSLLPDPAQSRQSRWIDRHTGLLFNEASPRTYRVRRDLRREAMQDFAVDLANWQFMRAGASDDDRALWTWLSREHHEWRRRFNELQESLGSRARLYLRRQRTPKLHTYLYVNRRAVRATSVRSDVLRAAGIRSLTMPIKEFGRAEVRIQEKVEGFNALADAIENSRAALRAVERRLAQRRTRPLIFPPLIARRVARLQSYRARGVEVLGTYCPTPHIQFEGWRVHMIAYADALKASIMTLNVSYNLHRKREHPRYGKPRRVRVGLISCMSDSSWLLPPLEWRLIKRAPQEGNVITSKVVKGLIRVRRGEWRETGVVEPVTKSNGRLNPAALSLLHQPEMYPLHQPFDDLVVQYNAIVKRVLQTAGPVMGTRPSIHPFGGKPRAEWVGTIKARWWV